MHTATRRQAVAVLLAALCAAPAHAATTRAARTAAARDSAAQAGVIPWNPPAPIPEARPWETALRLPGRIVSLPLSALGWATEQGLIFVEDHVQIGPGALPRGRGAVRFRAVGFGDHTGIGAGATVSRGLGPASVELEQDASVRRYERTRAAVKVGPASLTWGYEWRPQDRFYGLGPEAHGDESAFAQQGEAVQLLVAAHHGHDDPEHPVPRSDARAWVGPRSRVVRRGRLDAVPSADAAFPAYEVGPFDRRIENLMYGARLEHDTRGGVPHWGSGWRLALQVERADTPREALQLHNARTDVAQWTRWHGEAETAASFGSAPRSLRLAVVLEDLHVTSGGDQLLLSDLATLGGLPGLHGFSPGRFHDRSMALGTVTYLVPLVRRFELDLHSELGQVAHDLHRVTARQLRPSYGVALRGLSGVRPVASLGLDWSAEAVRVSWRFGGLQ